MTSAGAAAGAVVTAAGGGGRRLSTEFVRGGFRSVKRLFKQERVRFKESGPVLLIQPGGKQPEKQDSLASRQMHYIFTQQLGMKTFVSQAGHDPFPTMARVQQKVETAQRVGAVTICGVGDRSTLDLAKAVASAASVSNVEDDDDNDNDGRWRTTGRGHVERLVLVPHTYDAAMTCAHPYSLLLHDEEDALFPHDCSRVFGGSALSEDKEDHLETPYTETTVALLDSDAFWNRNSYAQMEALKACLVLLLDSLHRCDTLRNPEIFDVAEPLMQQIRLDMQQRNSNNNDHGGVRMGSQSSSSQQQEQQLSTEEAHQSLLDMILDVGSEFLKFGLDYDDPDSVRSAPLAVASTLLPMRMAEAEVRNKNTPNLSVDTANDLMAFMAATLPVLEPHHHHHSSKSSPSSAPFWTNESVDSLYQRVRQNQLLWKCQDATKHEIQALLQPFSLLPHSAPQPKARKDSAHTKGRQVQ